MLPHSNLGLKNSKSKWKSTGKQERLRKKIEKKQQNEKGTGKEEEKEDERGKGKGGRQTEAEAFPHVIGSPSARESYKFY